MQELTPAQRKHLRGLAQAAKPLVQIGRNGATEAQMATIDRALTDHELVKIKYLEHKEEKQELTEAIAAATRSHVIHLIGNTAVIYRESPDPARRQKLLQRDSLPENPRKRGRSPRPQRTDIRTR
jgi:RNA-binding protein